jgi:GR25 family glycosyltransferase involved in LPS biosynthesis
MSKNIDKIIYINLDRRKDRKEQIEQMLNEYGLPFERFSAFNIGVAGIGCFLSHLAILKQAYSSQYNNILILEDDFQIVVSKEEFEEQLTLFFKADLFYDVVMLSHNLIRSEQTKNSFLTRVLEAQTTSGYLVNRHYLKTLIDLYEWAFIYLIETKEHWNWCNDRIWKTYQNNDSWFCFTKLHQPKRKMRQNAVMTYIFYNYVSSNYLNVFLIFYFLLYSLSFYVYRHKYLDFLFLCNVLTD